MIIPVRCFGCGKPIGQYWEEYSQRKKAGEDTGKILNDLGLGTILLQSSPTGTRRHAS